MDTVSSLNTSIAGYQKNWDLDVVGNWDSSTTDGGSAVARSNNLQNQSTVVGAASLSFDYAGNTTKDESGKGYVYDAWNRLVTAKSSPGGSTIETFKYDPAGRRASENPGTAKDFYYSSQWQVLEEQVSGIATTQYVWSPTYVDELIERDRDVDAVLDGTLDSTFNTTGKVTTDFGGSRDDVARAVAIQSDGKTVVAGYADVGSGNYDFAVARYNTDGSLDSTFGTSGKTTVNMGASNDKAYAVAIQSDGKIVVAGQSGHTFALMRLSATGSLDTSFGTGGKVTTDFGASSDDLTYAYALIIQSDGKILAGGYTWVAAASHNEFAVARYLSGGTLDNGFSGDGKVTLYDSAHSLDDFGYAMALQSDGSVLVGVQSGGDLALGKFDSSGNPVTAFGGNGIVSGSGRRELIWRIRSLATAALLSAGSWGKELGRLRDLCHSIPASIAPTRRAFRGMRPFLRCHP